MDDRSGRRYLKRSLGLSIGLHLLVLPVLIAIFWTSAWGAGDLLGTRARDRSSTTVSYLRIEHRAPPSRSLARVRERVVPNASAPRRVMPFERPVLAHRAEVQTTGAATSYARAAAPARGTQRIAALTPAAADVDPDAAPSTPLPRATAVPTESPTPAPAPSASPTPPALVDAPPGGWGQSFEHPILADDTALDDLRSRYHAVAHASIEVDETGKPTRVTLPAGLSDIVRDDLERRLMDLHYVPAECNGLRCAGTLEISL